MIFGNHYGLREEGVWTFDIRKGDSESQLRRYCHSPVSWTRMWEEIFGKGRVDVKVALRDDGGEADFHGSFPGATKTAYEMEWSVTII